MIGMFGFDIGWCVLQRDVFPFHTGVNGESVRSKMFRVNVTRNRRLHRR